MGFTDKETPLPQDVEGGKYKPAFTGIYVSDAWWNKGLHRSNLVFSGI